MEKGKFIYLYYALLFLMTSAFSGCVDSQNFETLQVNCIDDLVANSSFSEVKALYVDETIQIQEDLIIEGYVTSSDKEGNFFSVLHFQDKAVNPSEGFRIEFDLIASHLFFPEGSKIFIKLKGLYLGKSSDVYKLGGTLSVFGNIFVGRLPAVAVREHIFISCDETTALVPNVIAIDDFEKNLTNTLVQLQDVQFVDDDLNQPYALEREETDRILTDCFGNELELMNSGFANFYEEILPSGNGSITGVLLRQRENFFLVIRSPDDIDFSNMRCE